MLVLYGQQMPLRTVSANTSLTAADFFVEVDTSAGNITITLPTAVGIKGQPFVVKNRTGSNKVIINTTASQTVDGQASGAVEITAKQALMLVSNDADWGIY